jgi:hypothetical protein
VNTPFYVTDVHGQDLFNGFKGHHTSCGLSIALCQI